MRQSPIFNKMSIYQGIISCSVLIVANHFIQQGTQKITIDNAAHAEKWNDFTASPTLMIFAALALFAPMLFTKWFTNDLYEHAKKLELARTNFEKNLLKNATTNSQSQKQIAPNPFQDVLHQAYDNMEGVQKFQQKNSVNLTQANAIANSLNDLSLKIKQKANDLAQSVRETGTLSTTENSGVSGILNDLMNLANSQSDKVKDTITALNAIKADMSATDRLLTHQNEIIGTKIQYSLQKKAQIAENLTSMCEKFSTDSRSLFNSTMSLTSEILGSAADLSHTNHSDPYKKATGIEGRGDSKNSGATKISTAQPKIPAISKDVTPQSVTEKKNIADKDKAKSPKADNKTVKEKLLNLKVEERKIPLRSDSRFEDL